MVVPQVNPPVGIDEVNVEVGVWCVVIVVFRVAGIGTDVPRCGRGLRQLGYPSGVEAVEILHYQVLSR